MDSDTIDFKVKGILQSVATEKVIMVQFISPEEQAANAKKAIEAAKARAADMRERNAQLQRRVEEDRAASQPRPAAPPPPSQEMEPAGGPQKSCPPHYNKSLPGGQYSHITFSNNKHDFHYTGDFTVKGGKIDVYIVDSDNFVKLVNHHKFNAIYAVKNVTEGNWDIPFQQGQDYHIVWWNTSAYDTRLIDADLCSRVIE